MKSFILSLVLILGLPAHTQSPPPAIKGQNNPTFLLPKPNLQVPFRQATNLGGLDALIETGNTNLLSNPGFEHQTYSTGWTASAGTSVEGTASNVGTGVKSYSWDASAASQTLTSTAVAIPFGYRLKAGEASCDFKTNATDYVIQAFDGTNVIAQASIPSNTNFSRVSVPPFSFPSSGSISIRIVSASDAAVIYTDDCYLGPATNIGSVAQAELVAKVTWGSAASGTGWQKIAGTGTVSIGDTASYNDSTKRYTLTRPGRYLFVGTVAKPPLTQNSSVALELNGGAIPSGSNAIFGQHPADSGVMQLTETVNVTSVPYTVSLAHYFPTSSVSVAGILDIYRFPSASEQVFRPDQVAWRVDANISGANASLGTASVSSYTGITNSALTLTNNTGAVVIAAQIPCSATNPPTGTTCAAGDESVGVSFNLPVAGDVLACASFSGYLQSGATPSDSVQAFQLVETPSNAQTILQEGRARMSSGSTVLPASSAVFFPMRVCGTFSFASAGQKTLRLMYEQAVTVAPSQSLIIADAAAASGQRDIKWEVYPLNYYQPAPLLIGSVVSGSTGIERVERLTFRGSTALSDCTGSPCTIDSQSGSWVTSVTRAGTGDYTVNFAAGTFSSTPTCVCVAQNRAAGIASTTCSSGPPSTSSVQLYSWRHDTNAAADSFVQLHCQGPR